MMNEVLPLPSRAVVLLGGSRSLAASPAVAPVVAGLLAGGCVLSVGCAAGADALVVSAAVAAGAGGRLSVCAVGASSGAGFWCGSASLVSLRAAAAAGARVSWLAGGSLAVPLRGRLLRRSLAALAGASLAVFFLASPSSAGSLRVAAAAVAAGVPAVAFCSVCPAPLAGVPAGAWSPVVFAGLPAFVWVPASVALQPALF